MATYSKEEKERILSYPVERLLSVLGKRTDHVRDMYFSPFRDEKTPSLHISRSQNLWMDFGDNTGGNVLTMASRLLDIPTSRAWDYVAGLLPGPIVSSPCKPASRRKPSSESRIVIDWITRDFFDERCIRYAEGRGIPSSILLQYCTTAAFHIRGRGEFRRTAIGFPCDGGGWILRLPSEGANVKLCTSSKPTFLRRDGTLSCEPDSPSLLVFEGFFDFLSWLVLHGKSSHECDVCVLNSTANLGAAACFIADHDDVHLWLDADAAGRKAAAAIISWMEEVTDHLEDLHGRKDLNELLMTSD